MPRSPRSYSHSFLLFAFLDNLVAAFSSQQDWAKTKHKEPYSKYQQTAYQLRRKGCLKIVTNSSGQRFLHLTEKGQLELLLAKAWLPKEKTWDGKWRIIMFDIPKQANPERDKLRRLLKNANFFKLQASTYINPYPLNREAIVYLKQTGLINYIRIGRLEELDDDKDLIKHFKLTK